MGESFEAIGVGEGANADSHGSRTLKHKTERRSRKEGNRNGKIAKKKEIVKIEIEKKRFENLGFLLALSVSGSLMRRTWRELGRTILR